MKIAYILPKLAKQGPIVVVKDIIDNIKDKAALIDVYYFDNNQEIDFDCNTYRISFFKKIDFDKYDIIHTHMLRPDLYVWFHKKKNKSFFISTLHQNIYDNLKGDYNRLTAFLFEKIWLYILRKHDKVVVLSDVMKMLYSKKTNLSLMTINNGRNYDASLYLNSRIKDNYIDRISRLKTKYKIIGCHCLLTKRKGVHQVIESLLQLEDFALVIIGDGQELKNLKQFALNLGVLNRCHFMGFKSEPIIYLKHFDLYVMASYSEGFPLGLLEAGLSKLPIVCSNIPIFKELFSEKEVCFFELENINMLSNSIRSCYNNKEILGSLTFNLINEKYSASKMATNYFKLYQDR